MFDYGRWAPGSRVQLCNVTWDAQYANLIDWSTVSRDSYFAEIESASIQISQMTYCAAGRPVRIPTPYAKAFQYNYIIVRNSTPVEGQSTYYYFITDMRYVAPNTTEIIVQLDVWTTYYERFRFGRFFLSRGHATNFLHHRYGTVDGREFLTRPEGLDVGSGYLIGDCNSWALANNASDYVFIVMSTVDLTADWGDENDPKLKSASGGNVGKFRYATQQLVGDHNAFNNLVVHLKEYPWISQGIMAVYTAPANLVRTTGSARTNAGKGPTLAFFDGSLSDTHTYWSDLRGQIMAKIPERYRSLAKFATAPYTYIELTTYTGTPLIFGPEMVTNDALVARVWANAVAPSPRIMFTIADLNQNGSKPNPYLGYEEHLDAMTGITNLPQLPVLNNNATMYAASNAHSIEYARQSAKWQQQKSIAGANLSMAQTSAGINASYAQTANSNAAGAANLAIGINARNQQWAVDTAFGVGGGIIKGAASGAGGGPAGMIAGAAIGGAGAGIGAAQSYLSNQITNDAATASYNVSANAANAATDISAGLSRYIADGNLQLATANARGDYANAIAGINAKLQDAELTPPSISGQLGGDMLQFNHFGMRCDARIKIPTMGAIRAIGEFWFRYGYAFNGFINPPQNLMCMERLTYWQCVEANVFGSLPQNMIDVVRGALQRGTTVWRHPSYVGTIDPADNNYNEESEVHV